MLKAALGVCIHPAHTHLPVCCMTWGQSGPHMKTCAEWMDFAAAGPSYLEQSGIQSHTGSLQQDRAARGPTSLTVATSLMSASSLTEGSSFFCWLRSVRKPSPTFWRIIKRHMMSPHFETHPPRECPLLSATSYSFFRSQLHSLLSDTHTAPVRQCPHSRPSRQVLYAQLPSILLASTKAHFLPS